MAASKRTKIPNKKSNGEKASMVTSTEPETAPPNGDGKPERIFAPDDPMKEWTNEEGVRHISQYDVLQLERLRNKIDALTAQAQTLELQANEKQRTEAQKVLAMRSAAKNHTRQRAEIEEQYTTLTETLGAKYSIDFKRWGYDDESGKLTEHTPEA